MKSILPFLILLLIVPSVQAQVSFGIRAGVNFSTINGENAAGNNLDNKIKAGLLPVLQLIFLLQMIFTCSQV